MSRRELAIALLLFMGLLAPLIETPIANAIIPQDQTISIVDTHDDKWTTGTGIGIDSWLVHVLDPNYDVYTWVIFRDVEINNWEPLKNATLRLYTGNTLDFDKESIITIYGMKADELQNILPIGPSYAVSVPKTDHYVNFNTSQFYGVQWWDIDVTAIVEELIRAHNWDGDGLTSDDVGDAIGFIMLGASGNDVRYFTDYRTDPALSAQLVIHWNHQPPLNDPPDDYEFIEQHGNYSIWYETTAYPFPLGPLEYAFIDKNPNLDYDKIHSLPGTSMLIEGGMSIDAHISNSQRKIARTSNGTLYAVYLAYITGDLNIYFERSIDDGLTWINKTRISTYAGMNSFDQYGPCVAMGYNDSIHVVWEGEATGISPRQLWYAEFNGTDWLTPIRISTLATMENYIQAMGFVALNSSGVPHITWRGATSDYPTKPQIQYSTRYANGSFTRPLRISINGGGAVQSNPTMALGFNDTIHVAWSGGGGGYGVNQIWYRNFTTAWNTILRVSDDGEMNTQPQYNPNIITDCYEISHIVWYGRTTTYPANYQIWYNQINISSGTPLRLSTYAGMAGKVQEMPSIMGNSTENLHVLWHGKATGYTVDDVIWYVKNTGSWSYPECIQSDGENIDPNTRWARWPELYHINATGEYFNTDPNGTKVQGPFDTLQQAQDCIDSKDTDPLDPDPPGWVTEGPFTRFKMRLYLLVIGYFAIWGPIWFMCWRRPSGYHICGGLLIMLMGLGLLLQIVYV